MTLDAGMRGLVNELIYPGGFGHQVKDAYVAAVADAVVAQRIFSSPVASYRAAAAKALQDSDGLADRGDTDRRARDFLQRLVRALDDRRPWPRLPYQELGPDGWTKLLAAPLIGRLNLAPRIVTDRLSRRFTKIADARYGLILRLESGQTVGLLNNASLTGDVEVRSDDDPDQTRADLRELTGLEVQVPGLAGAREVRQENCGS